MVFAAVGVGGKLLVPVLDPADRAVEADGEGGADEFFGQQDALVAEAAADVGRDDADLALVEAEAFGEAGLGDVRHLGGGGDDQLLEPGVPFGQHAAAFEGGHALPGRAQAAGDAGGGDGVEAGEVVVAGGFEEGVVGPVFVDAGGAGCAGAQHVGDGGERVVVEFALAGEVFGEGAAAGDAGGDGFADVAQLAGRERRLHRRGGSRAGRSGRGWARSRAGRRP